jgi:hypothetical protein
MCGCDERMPDWTRHNGADVRVVACVDAMSDCVQNTSCVDTIDTEQCG